jgi:ABC-2 type transport system ATP-binding protein
MQPLDKTYKTAVGKGRFPMQTLEENPASLRDLPICRERELGAEVALLIQGVSKTFTRSARRGKAAAKPVAWRERMSWRGLRDGVASAGRREKKRVVDNVTLTAHCGEALGVLGPNGCGKSTLVRMISTLLIPDEGRIRVFGHDVVGDAHSVKCLINRVSVDAAFFKKLSALENLLYTARLYDVRPAVALKRAGDILERLGFDREQLDNSMEQLSRGQQQKVAIARAFLTSPKLVLLDEPTTGLDPKSKKEVEAFIKGLRESKETTVLLTTHDMAEAEALCDRIAILNKGKLVALGTAQELKARYRKPESASPPTLEEVFIELAGETLEQADEVDEPGGD